MNNEAEVCTVLKNTMISKGCKMYKIPDPTSDFRNTIQRPFDMFGISISNPYYIEVKFMNKLMSFNLNKIENHQIRELTEIKRLNPNARCWIVLGIKVSKMDSRIYIFKDIMEIEKRRTDKENYLKKELETLPYYSVKSGIIKDFEF